MGATRKLQGEIDRVLKKVQEGVDVFDSIWNKVYDTENANQKEKFEADLKKEIKKLQRYRDQIKSWIQSSEIKDKKVNASYEQALLDARKSIEREMERFKVCEKETKTKAFSKEGLGQLPKPDPREKAKGESRDWLNNMVSELESQIDTFEAELEGLSVKKGKTRPPRLTHLEDSIGRHKAHITKLELILRLLDNDELSPEEVNDVKEFVEDYVERNQDDFEEFADVDELYNSLPLDKIEALENLDAVPSIAPSVIVKEKAAVAAASGAAATNAVTLKQPILAPGTQQTVVSNSSAASIGVVQQLPPSPQLDEESGSSPVGNIVIQSTTSGVISISGTSAGSPGLVPAAGGNLLVARGLAGASSLVLPINDVRGSPKSVAMPSSAVNIGAGLKEEEPLNLLDHRVAPGVIEVGFTRGLGRGAVSSNLGSLESSSLNAMALGAATLSTSAVGVSSGPIIVSTVADSIKRTELIGDDERVTSGGLSQQLASSLSMQNRTFLQPSTKPADASGIADANSATEGGVIGGRIYSPVASDGQWRPQTANALQTSTESFLVRTEIAPDQKQKFLQRLQKAHQQQQTATLLSSSQQFSQMTGTSQKPQQVLPSQQTALMQQLQLLNQQQQTPLVQTSQNVIQQQQQVGLQLGVQASGISTATLQNPQQSQLAAASSHQFHQQLLAVTKEADSTPNKEQQSQENVPDETSVFPRRILLNDDDIKNSDTFEAPIGGPGTLSEFNQLPRDSDLTPGQPLQPSQSFAGPGVIGRRSMDLGAIGDNVTTSPASGHSQLYNLQMLEAAYHKIPLPKDSERLRKYVPRHPAVTPSSYPQVPAQIIDNPALWERLDTDALFFAFYYQQGTYQQYLAARELKRQSWRYHKKYNTWFQRHEEPKVTTDEYEQGTYVYFDFHIVHDDFQQGWCQRIKTEFTFEYSYLEDELT